MRCRINKKEFAAPVSRSTIVLRLKCFIASSPSSFSLSSTLSFSKCSFSFCLCSLLLFHFFFCPLDLLCRSYALSISGIIRTFVVSTGRFLALPLSFFLFISQPLVAVLSTRFSKAERIKISNCKRCITEEEASFHYCQSFCFSFDQQCRCYYLFFFIISEKLLPFFNIRKYSRK